jgi:hypothetical protein
MPPRFASPRAFHWLAALSLAAYGVVGVFGHSLHGLLPCADESCGSGIVAAVEGLCSCCHHDHAPAATASGPATDGAEFRAAGHDADDCSLCTLLAKIKVGQLALFDAEIRVESSNHESIFVGTLLPADLILSGSPRGPPQA